MNFFAFFLSRAAALILVGLVILGIQSFAVGLRQRHQIVLYQKLGQAVADPGTADAFVWLWPPQATLAGKFHGKPFLYARFNGVSTHLMVECRPASAVQMSRHRGQIFYRDGSLPDIDQRFPEWTGFYASPTTVPWIKRSVDRRPIGFGRQPGIGLYRQTPVAFDPERLRSDLSGLVGLCTD
jgi:hypothetical protein